MLPKTTNLGQMGFYSTFEEQLNHKHPLYILANQIHWLQFEEAFKDLYCFDNGRPRKPIRLMVSLLMLKHIRNLSDESVVEQWAENAYYQYFSGEKCFAAKEPCEASELVHFRKRIGEKGIELIFKESIRINGKDADEDEGTVDTTVQEKNITYPTDNKLHRKIIKNCVAIAEKETIELRQSYTRTLKKLSLDQRFRNHPKNYKKARKVDRKVKTIAGRLLRELERKLPAGHYASELALFQKVLSQKRNDHNKIYSLHEPHVGCISKGKEHKKYEFGSNISITTTKKSGVIIGAINIEKNDYDAHTLEPALEQQQRLTGHTLQKVFVDRGCRGVNQVRGTEICIPKPFAGKLSAYQQQKMKTGFRRRAAIEPRISHLKSDYRLSRNFYKGIFGDNINVMLSAAAMNFKRMMNIYKKMFLDFFIHLLSIIQNFLLPEKIFYFNR
ncbi:MAG: IS5 family transposase [Chitinophagaceae bacterium]|nr:IS5 family transposase [Chitinophagaceae bacterium]